MTKTTDTSPISLLACEDGFDPIEDRLRANIRGAIAAVFAPADIHTAVLTCKPNTVY